LKELVLRTNVALFGHRLAMDYVAPGGVARLAQSATMIHDECDMLEHESAAEDMTIMTGCRIGFAVVES
jgi:hypothetical protein